MEKYEIVRPLGHGTFGNVSLVIRTADRAQFAVKQVRCPDLSAANSALSEAFIMRAYEHQNVVKYHDMFLHEDNKQFLVCLVMDYYEEGDLAQLLREYSIEDAMPLPYLLALTSQIANGLDFLHSRNLIHRDLKPANILLQKGKMQAVITDFGLVKSVAQQSSKTVSGTPGYMAPEQARGKYGAPVDLWALGCILYDMMAPGHEVTVMYMEALMQGEAFQRSILQQLEAPGCWPMGLICLALSMLVVEPEKRPTAAAVVAELKTFSGASSGNLLATDSGPPTHMATATPVTMPPEGQSRSSVSVTSGRTNPYTHRTEGRSSMSHVPELPTTTNRRQHTPPKEAPPVRTGSMKKTPSMSSKPAVTTAKPSSRHAPSVSELPRQSSSSYGRQSSSTPYSSQPVVTSAYHSAPAARFDNTQAISAVHSSMAGSTSMHVQPIQSSLSGVQSSVPTPVHSSLSSVTPVHHSLSSVPTPVQSSVPSVPTPQPSLFTAPAAGAPPPSTPSYSFEGGIPGGFPVAGGGPGGFGGGYPPVGGAPGGVYPTAGGDPGGFAGGYPMVGGDPGGFGGAYPMAGGPPGGFAGGYPMAGGDPGGFGGAYPMAGGPPGGFAGGYPMAGGDPGGFGGAYPMAGGPPGGFGGGFPEAAGGGGGGGGGGGLGGFMGMLDALDGKKDGKFFGINL